MNPYTPLLTLHANYVQVAEKTSQTGKRIICFILKGYFPFDEPDIFQPFLSFNDYFF